MNIQPKVANILNEYTVVINKGSEDGIKIGDKFLIFGIGPEITDPDTNESLGYIELVRGQVRVTHLQDRIATARSIMVERIPGRKRTIEGAYRISILGGQKETYEYPDSDEEKPLDDPKVGDFARFI